jgi:hypothetical protein
MTGAKRRSREAKRQRIHIVASSVEQRQAYRWSETISELLHIVLLLYLLVEWFAPR